MSGLLSGIVSAVSGGGGGIVSQVLEVAKAYFPPDLSPEKRREFEIDVMRIDAKREKDLNEAIADAERALNERIAQHEGTASDLKAIPILGPIMLFLRGAQRPIWGFGTMYLDFQVFSGAWSIEASPQKLSAFYIINLLVLGFLFGERAIKNIAPLVAEIVKARGGVK